MVEGITAIPKSGPRHSIPEMVDGLSREEVRRMYKGGKLTAHGRGMEKVLDRVLPGEKVDDWGGAL